MKLGDEMLEVSVRIEVRNPQRGDHLAVSETVHIRPRGFLEVAAILGRFHELAEKVQAEEGKVGLVTVMKQVTFLIDLDTMEELYAILTGVRVSEHVSDGVNDFIVLLGQAIRTTEGP